MEICLMLEGQEGISWEQWVSLARAAERAGLAALFRSDHYRSINLGDPAGSLDAWTTLAGLAACTERIRLGTLVSPVTFRHPSVLAKSVVTVDHISGGRVELGIGAGWFEPEHVAYGFPFGTTRSRLDALDAQLAEINRQWLQAADVWPKPLQQPRPPIIVGGRAKPRTVKAALRHADEYNSVSPTLEQARAQRTLLDAAAARAGRQPLRFSMMVGCVVGRDERETQERLAAFRAVSGGHYDPALAGTLEQVAGRLERYAEAGVERAMLQQLDADDLDMVAVLGELQAMLRRAP